MTESKNILFELINCYAEGGFVPPKFPQSWSSQQEELLGKNKNRRPQDIMDDYQKPQQQTIDYQGQLQRKSGELGKKIANDKRVEGQIINQGNLSVAETQNQIKDYLFHLAKERNLPPDTYNKQIQLPKATITSNLGRILKTPHYQHHEDLLKTQYEGLQQDEKRAFDTEIARLSAMKEDFGRSQELARSKVFGNYDALRNQQGQQTLSYQNQSAQKQADINRYNKDTISLEEAIPLLQSQMQQFEPDTLSL